MSDCIWNYMHLISMCYSITNKLQGILCTALVVIKFKEKQFVQRKFCRVLCYLGTYFLKFAVFVETYFIIVLNLMFEFQLLMVWLLEVVLTIN